MTHGHGHGHGGEPLTPVEDHLAEILGTIAAEPYCETCSGSTSISATTLPPYCWRASIILISSGSRLSMMSSPSRTANGSSPTCRSAQSTAWPSPFGSPCRT